MAAAVFSIVIFVLLCLPRAHNPTPIEISTKIEFFLLLRENLSELTLNEQLNELKDNFLLNQKIKDRELRGTFESAGLSHLLALSGGQTGPAAMAVCFCCAFGFLNGLALLGYTHRYSLIHATRLFVLLSKLLVIVFLTCLFQGTGALTRILSLEISLLLLFWARQQETAISGHSTIFIASIDAIIPWILCSLLSKNPTDDLSFLLSALGSSTVMLISRVLSRILNQSVPPNTPIFRRLTIRATQLMTHWIATSSLTCVSMCLFCFQLWPIGNLSQKIAANLLAGPVVLLLITPAILAVIVTLSLHCEFLLKAALAFLDFALRLFIKIGEAFASTDSPTGMGASLTWVRPGESYSWNQHPYLSLILITLALMVLHQWLFSQRVWALLHPPAPKRS